MADEKVLPWPRVRSGLALARCARTHARSTGLPQAVGGGGPSNQEPSVLRFSTGWTELLAFFDVYSLS